MRRRFAAYAFALAAVAVAILLRLSLQSFLGNLLPLLLQFFAVLLTASCIQGRGPAIVAMIAGVLGAEYFILTGPDSFPLILNHRLSFALYVVASLTMIELVQGLQRARRRADSRQRDLEREVRARRATERALAERERLLTTTFTSIGDAVIMTDATCRVISLNPVAEAFTGWPSGEAAGQPAASIFTAVDEQTREPVRDPAGQVIRLGAFEGRSEHTVLISRDGTERAIELSAAPIRDDDGNDDAVLGVVLVFRDISKQREAARTLMEADRRKDQFLAMLAHELRNPLAPITTSLELMKRQPADAGVVDAARRTIERQVCQLVRLVDDLMDVSRITRGMLRLKKQRMELAASIQEAVEICRPLCTTRNHTLRLSIPESTPIFVDADPVRLTQVLSNVLNNACKYTDPGGEIELTAALQGRDTVVEIRDSGIGIAPEMLPKVFELFTQADGSIERAAGGLGIGLSLVRQLVEMHDGRIEVLSAGIGRGTQVRITLPAAAAADEQAAQPAPTAAPACPPARQRILVVDDNADGAQSLAVLLRLLGNDVEVASDGPEALARTPVHRPELVFLDIGLPEMDGYQVCRTLRATPWGGRIMIVALTGWGQDEDRRKSREAGFDVHLVKPLDYDALMKVLADARNRAEAEVA